MEQHLAAAQPGLGHRGAQRGGGLVVERAEQRRLTQHVVVHGVLLRRGPDGRGVPADPSQWRGSQCSVARRARPSVRRRTLSRVPVAPTPAVPRARRPHLVRRARKIDRVLAETYPDARCELDFDNPFELLVVTVLQRPDHRQAGQRGPPDPVRGLPRRRARWPPPTASKLEQIIQPAGLLPGQDRVAAQAQRRPWSSGTTARCRRGSTTWSRCPGVGRKTANVVLGNAFGIPGITVDTHFGRLARRFGWTDGDRPGQGRARGRRAVPQARLDDAQPPPDLARPPRLPRPQARPAAPARSPAGARRTARARPTRSSAAKLVRTEGRA